jgi:hypothetical protein
MARRGVIASRRSWYSGEARSCSGEKLSCCGSA